MAGTTRTAAVCIAAKVTGSVEPYRARLEQLLGRRVEMLIIFDQHPRRRPRRARALRPR